MFFSKYALCSIAHSNSVLYYYVRVAGTVKVDPICGVNCCALRDAIGTHVGGYWVNGVITARHKSHVSVHVHVHLAVSRLCVCMYVCLSVCLYVCMCVCVRIFAAKTFRSTNHLIAFM